MPEAINGSTTIHYDTKGSSEDPAILLIMGFTEPMTSFRDGFCQLLVEAGNYVIRFELLGIRYSNKKRN